jgi:hypothetical protein
MTNDAKLQRNRRAEWFGLALQYALAGSFITGAALVAFMGKLYAAVALLALAALIVLRLKRGRVNR